MTKMSTFVTEYVITWISLKDTIKILGMETILHQFTFLPSESTRAQSHSTNISLTRRDFQRVFCPLEIASVIETAPFLALAGSLLLITFFLENGGKKEVLTQCLVHCFILLSKGGKKRTKPFSLF